MFARTYGLDLLIPIRNFLLQKTKVSTTSSTNSVNEKGDIEMNQDVDAFIRYIVKRLESEQKNRLKTEE